MCENALLGAKSRERFRVVAGTNKLDVNPECFHLTRSQWVCVDCGVGYVGSQCKRLSSQQRQSIGAIVLWPSRKSTSLSGVTSKVA